MIDLWRWDGESDKNNAITQLKNSGLDVENLVQIVNPDADLLLPVFTEFSISGAGDIDVESDSIVKISGNVSDADGSGFSSLHIILVDGNGTEKSISLNKDSEELTEAGDFTLDIDFKYSAAGTWRLKEAFLMDEAGNQASYYDGDWDSDDEAAKFLASGIDLEQFTFDISNNNQQDISLPQITELLLQEMVLRLNFRGLLMMVSWVQGSMSFGLAFTTLRSRNGFNLRLLPQISALRLVHSR